MGETQGSGRPGDADWMYVQVLVPLRRLMQGQMHVPVHACTRWKADSRAMDQARARAGPSSSRRGSAGAGWAAVRHPTTCSGFRPETPRAHSFCPDGPRAIAPRRSKTSSYPAIVTPSSVVLASGSRCTRVSAGYLCARGEISTMVDENSALPGGSVPGRPESAFVRYLSQLARSSFLLFFVLYQLHRCVSSFEV